ncbi:MAG: sugar-binding protein, partial [Myxococcota bacterium]
AWARARKLDEPFVTFQPTYGDTPTGTTDVWILADHDGLHLFAEMTDPEPDKVRGFLGRRDTRWNDDFFAIYLDPTGQAQRAYLFLVSAGGILHDGTATAAAGEDTSWDAAWSGQARRTDRGYDVEMSIPWRSVRHPSDVSRVGMFVFRHVARLGQKSSWPALDPEVSGLLVQEGILAGPGPIPQDAGLDLLPELTFARTDQGPPERWFGWEGATVGLTTRYRPAPWLSLVGTFNPDFSQVESDAAQVSVNRRNALYFQEKRPFFLDGQEWFSHPLGELVYTRTVVAPYGGVRFTVEPPGATVAGLVAFDSTPAASVAELGGWTEEDIDGHDASVAVVRARRDVGADGQVGLLLSDRTILGTPMTNKLGGVDARIRLSDRTTVTGSALGSTTTFADGTTRTAPAGNTEIAYNARVPYFGTWANLLGPDFRAENGFITQTDRIGGGSWAGVNLYPDSAAVPKVNLQPLSVWYAWTFGGDLRDLGAEVTTNVSFGNSTSLSGGGWAKGERFAETWLEQRGGWAWFGGTPVRWLTLGTEVSLSHAPLYDPEAPRVGERQAASAEVTVRPVPMWSVALSGSAERFTEPDGAARALVYQGFVSRLRTEVFLSRTVSGRAIVDVDSFQGTRRGEVLLAWERSPGTGVYLGGSGALAPEPGWTVFAKVSALFSP